MAAYIFKLQVTNLSFDRRTFCTSLSSVEIHFKVFSIEQILYYFHCVFYVNVIYIFMYNIYKRIIHNLICSDAHFISCFANSCNLIKFLKQYLNIFVRNFVLCIQIRFVSTEKTTRIVSRASCSISDY